MNEVELKVESGLTLDSDNRTSSCVDTKTEPEEPKIHEVEFNIPPHVLGQDLQFNEADSSSSGKRLQKPRPGVKVPYRNLSSTIVTRDEIAQEILEQFRKRTLTQFNYKYMSVIETDTDDVLHSMKHNNLNTDQSTLPSQSCPQKKASESASRPVQGSDNSPIKDTDELLSILEGNESKVDVLNKTSDRVKLEHGSSVLPYKPYKLIKLYPELERELALKQLSEFTTPRKKKESNTADTPKEKKQSKGMKKVVEVTNKSRMVTNKQSEANRKQKSAKKPVKSKQPGKRKLNAEPIENPKRKKVSSRTNGNCIKVEVDNLDTEPTITADVDMISCTIDSGFLPNVPLKDNGSVRKFVNKKKVSKSDTSSGTNVHINGKDDSNENGDCDIKTTDSIPKNRKILASKKSESLNSNGESSVDRNSSPSKSSAGSPASVTKKKSSAMREIERLLGDEGAINMIYSVEQKRTLGSEPSRRGILPSTRRKKKDLILKTRLVKSAVMRLSNSPSQSLARTALRARRDSSTPFTSATSGISSMAQDSGEMNHNSSDHSPPFITPSKLSVPAEASRIIRRHSSSSSYSSRSNSPRRLSIDTEKTLAPLSPLSSSEKLNSESDSSPKKLVHHTTKCDKSTELEPPKTPTTFLLNNNSLKLSPNSDQSHKQARFSSMGHNRLLKREEIKEILRRASDTRNSETPVVFKRDIHDKLNAEISRTIMKNMIAAKLDKSNRKLDESEIECYIKAVSSSENRSSSSNSTSTSCTPEASTSLSMKSEASPFAAPLSPTPFSYSNLVKNITSESQKKKDSDNEKHRSSHRQTTGGSHSYKEISLRRYDHLVQIILTPISTKMKNAFNSQVFKEMSSVLSCLRKDESCRVVLMTSTGSAFCYGIDITALMQPTPEKRKSAAVEMLLSMKEFIKSLATFNKPLIAGVHGAAVGLGVTMLPFFDMVFASDKATFHTPYARLGQVPEGAATLTLPQMLGNAVTSELLFGCRKLTASEALHFGLVTRILWPDRFQEELIPLIRGIATQSSQSMEATKALLRHSLCTKLDPALLSESHLLLQHWTSNECQECFKQYLEEETPTMQK